jgi:phenylalanine-4-hydroxylase
MNAGVPFAGTAEAAAPKAGAEDIVQLDQNHPGFRDPDYRARRNHIAQQALRWKSGDPVPDVQYTDTEQSVWRTVWEHLAPLHHQHASGEYKVCSQRVSFSRQRIPQLREVNQKLASIPAPTGYQMVPVAGLVTSRAFLGNLRFDQFLSTQYIRHHTVPLYTPEPDIVHELVGHAATLADPGFAELNRAFGRAAERVSEDVLKQIERVYWYTLEFGVAKEGEQLKAYGAGLLSSFGELERFKSHARLVPLNIDAMTARPYDPTVYQEVLFVAPSFQEAVRTVTRWLDSVAR